MGGKAPGRERMRMCTIRAPNLLVLPLLVALVEMERATREATHMSTWAKQLRRVNLEE